MGNRLIRLRNPAFRKNVMVEAPANSLNPEEEEEEGLILKGEVKSKPSSVYVDGQYGYFDQELRHATLGFDGSTWSGGVGFDALIHPDLILGVSARAVYSQTSFDENAGSTETDGVVGGVYASYLKNGYFLDGLLSFGQMENELRRNTNLDGAARAEPDSDFVSGYLAAGKFFPLESFQVGPYFSADWVSGSVDGYQETGSERTNTVVEKHQFDSLLATIGASGNYSMVMDCHRSG